VSSPKPRSPSQSVKVPAPGCHLLDPSEVMEFSRCRPADSHAQQTDVAGEKPAADEGRVCEPRLRPVTAGWGWVLGLGLGLG